MAGHVASPWRRFTHTWQSGLPPPTRHRRVRNPAAVSRRRRNGSVHDTQRPGGRDAGSELETTGWEFGSSSVIAPSKQLLLATASHVLCRDWETYSEANIEQGGALYYAAHPTTLPL